MSPSRAAFQPQPSLLLTSLLRRSRNVALSAVRGVGGFDVAARSQWRQRRLMVLCYHGVSVADEHEWSGLYVSQERLRERIVRLRRLGCAVLPLAEAVERLAHGDLPPRAVALTFDDGAADFATRAYPVLAELNIPAMLYQTTWYVDRPFPVFNTMASYLLWKGRGRDVKLPWLAERARLPHDSDSSEFKRLHRSAIEHVAAHALDTAAQNELLASLATCVGASMEPLLEHRILQLMSSEQIRALDPHLIDIQLHTHRHRTPNDKARFIRELEDNRHALARILGDVRAANASRHFCYPSGVYTRAFAEWLREYGIQSSTTCDPGIATPETDLMFVPRLVDTMKTPDVVFDAWVSGAAALMPRRRHA